MANHRSLGFSGPPQSAKLGKLKLIKSCFDSYFAAAPPPPLNYSAVSAGVHEPSDKMQGKMFTGPETEADKESLTFEDASPHYSLQRQLKNRHISMIR